MARTRQPVTLISHFRQAKEAGHDAVADAIGKGTDEMHDEASRRLDTAAGARGYNLYSTDISHEAKDDEGTITYRQWYGKFFEYGTPTIAALPFMRPGHRKGRAKLLNELGDNFEGWIRRKAGISGFRGR